ncbi:MAG TPA: PEP-CTERM sorting domain-containing protein, partial [Acetobacteraceae bacterium]|nr:PEP-CTERM sorting domain-containing protein [Acetobacteraceae bacterium]
SVGAGSGGANNATISTDSITTSGVPVATIIGGFVGLGGNNPSSLNFLVSSSDLLASQNLGNIAANGSAAVNYSKTFSLVNLNSIDSVLIGLGTYLVEFGTSTYITTGASSGNTSADVATSETLNLALTYTYEEAPPPPVPEPASMALLGSGLLGLGMMIRRRRRS